MDAKLVECSIVLQVILETCLDGHVVSDPGDCGFGVRDGAGQSDRFAL